MKIKVKSFVFAGVAAAMFAGHAMAVPGDTVVTSKAYVDQKLGLKANTADLATVATTGSYNDLSNKPAIPAAQVNADWNASSGVAQILNKPTLATVATTGSYNDLSNKPAIPAAQVNADWNASSGVAQILNKPTIPTAVSDLTNDSGFITASDVPGAQTNADWNATSGAAQILNKPTLATVATTGSYNDLSNKPTLGSAAAADTTDFATAAQGALAASAVQPGDLATVATTGDYDDLTNKPTIPAAQVNADWNASSGVAQILNKPTLSAVATSGNYSDLSGTPNLATVATTGDYDDLTNKPTIPAAQVNADWNASSGVAQILNKPTLGSAAAADTTDFATAAQGALAASAVQPGDLATVATTGSYNDLSNKPTIPAAQVNADWNASSGVAQILNKPTLATVATTGSYNDLSNKPTLGSAAAADTTDFATAAQGALADTAIQPGTCTSEDPCALVNNAWVRIAQAGDQ